MIRVELVGRMIVDSDVLARARKGRRDAVMEVLSAQYPGAYRLAYAISGRDDVGNGVVHHVMKQSFKVLHTWADEEAPQRWFRHHTLLTVRRAARWKPDPDSDTLIRAAATPDTQYVAFIRALRALTQQQMEAFILTHGEGLDVRGTAVAMDCSTIAARMHRDEAEQRMRELAGERYADMLIKLRDAHTRLAPTEDLVLSRVGRSVRRWLLPRRIRRVLMLAILVLVTVVVAWVAWHFGADIADVVRRVLSTLPIA